MLEENMKNKICSLEWKNGEWTFKDCKGKELKPLPKRFPKATLKNNYKDYRKQSGNNMPEESFACVWVLMGRKEQTEKCIQVGRNCNLENMLEEDIIKDIKDFFYGSKKYSKLRKKCQKQETYKLTFYEVNIQEYLKEDTVINQILGKRPVDNPSLLKAYSYVEAAYVEGKLGCYSKNSNNHGIVSSMYNPSTLDGYFYDYFKKKKK
jgi:hypothetical protein